MNPLIEKFKNGPRKALTLMGMSGVGKTHWAWALEKAGWHHYNHDYLIGTKYLRDELGESVKTDDLTALSNYVGQVGRGSVPVEEFKRRQARYIEAERQSLYDMCDVIDHSPDKFVNDSTGSICEIEDEALFRTLADHTLFVYIRAGKEEGQALVGQAFHEPKPLYFQPQQFDEWLAEFMKQHGYGGIDDFSPNEFSQWVFPKLFYSRLPKYQRIAEKYGVTVALRDLRTLKNADEFLKVIGFG
ncbi:MAG: hypothetical protein WBK55_00915 [Alphaproteobacteria bacterium]